MMIALSITTVLGLLAFTVSAQPNSVLSRDALPVEVRRFAAIGDSFAAGIGSGVSDHTTENVGEKCSRYDGGYPYQLASLLEQHTPTNWYLKNLACSGATIPEIWENQAQNLLRDEAYNLITISAGGKTCPRRIPYRMAHKWLTFATKGNDLGFGDIVARCFYVVDGPDKKEPMNNCRDALDKATAVMNSAAFKADLSKLIKTAKEALHPDGRIVFNSYARFFDSATPACNDVTWAGYKTNYKPIYLSKELRTTANKMVDDLNRILRETVESVSNVIFIDINEARGDLKPYCAPGVDESHKMPDGTKWKNPSGAQFWQIEWTRKENNDFDMASIIFHREFSWSNVLPVDWFTDFYKRTFHPTLAYHKQIADLVFKKYQACLTPSRATKRVLRFAKRSAACPSPTHVRTSDKDDHEPKNESSGNNGSSDTNEPPEFKHPAAATELTELEKWERDGVEQRQGGKCVYSVSGGGNMNVFLWDMTFLGPGTAEAVDDKGHPVTEGTPWSEGSLRPIIWKQCQKTSGIHRSASKWDQFGGYHEKGSKRGWGRVMFFFRWAADRCGEKVLAHAAKAAQEHILTTQATARYKKSRNYPDSQILSDADKLVIQQDVNRELAEKAKNPDEVFGSDYHCKKVSHADHEADNNWGPKDVDNGPQEKEL